ncbi:hypothetical protein [Salibacter halophilus]|uniref:hypothetical protein n=1 Tax=Salibacter halophilus TaxID=1803916 RepID=UPI0012440061|nr:hypothetical protein [Salibacter halophilus]
MLTKVVKNLSFNLLIILLSIPALSFAQEKYPKLEINGKVVDGGNRLDQAYVRVEKDGEIDREIRTDSRGRFDLELELFHEFMLYFGKEGYITKKIYVDTRTIPEDAISSTYLRYGGWEVEIFENDLDVNTLILDKPIGKVKYDPNYGQFANDKGYTKSIQRELDQLVKDLEAAREAELMRQEQLEEDYKIAIEDGDRFMEEGDYENAMFQYEGALQIKPDERYPQKQIEKAKEKLSELKDEQQRYSSFLTQGDDAFYEEKWEEAIGFYEQALSMKPEEEYPQNQIEKARKKIEESKKREELKEEYDKVIAQADKAFNNEQLKDAKSLYKKALDILDDEQYPNDQIAKIDEQLEAERQKDEKYANAMEEGDRQMSQRNYRQAISFYQSALDTKPDESEPKQKIQEAQDILANIAEKEQAEQERLAKLEEEYNNLIAQADEAFNNEEWSSAKDLYQQALTKKKGEQYPTSQLKIINEKLGAIAEKDEEYNTAMKRAETAFKKQEYTDAQSLYQEALSIKPGAEEPKEMIAKIDELLAEIAARKEREKEAAERAERMKQAKYDSLVNLADAAFDNEEYKDARPLYQQATQVKPDEQHPSIRLREISELIDEREALEAEYKRYVTQGDQLFGSGKLEAARGKYEAALELIDQQYPKDQIAKIDERFAEKKEERLAAERREKARNQKYDSLIAIADNQFTDSLYNDAISNYEKALNVKANEEYPVSQIEAAKGIQEELLAKKRAKEELERKKEEYIALIDQGDAQIEEEAYKTAIERYESAIALFPDREKAKEKKRKAEELLAEKQAEEEAARQAKLEKERKEKEYSDAVAAGDKAFESENYEEAIASYENAQEVFPDRSYPQNRIEESKDKIAELERLAEQKRQEEERQRRLNAEYDSLIAVADNLFKEEQFSEARSRYENAQNIKPNESYPKSQINTIVQIMEERRKEATRFAEGATEFNYQLAEDYPEGRTEEEFEEGNKKVTRIVIVKGDVGHEYLKEEYSWGQTFYLKDKKRYSKTNWLEETKE